MQPLEAMKLRAKTDRHSNHHPTVNAVLAAKPERCDPQGLFHPVAMSRSSPEERISDLCSQATAATDQAELDITFLNCRPHSESTCETQELLRKKPFPRYSAMTAMPLINWRFLVFQKQRS
jgi:hypothetical protein